MRKPIGTAQGILEDYPNRIADHEAIAARAYELWLLRGSPIGSPEIDWLQAEAELTEQPQTATAHSFAA